MKRFFWILIFVITSTNTYSVKSFSEETEFKEILSEKSILLQDGKQMVFKDLSIPHKESKKYYCHYKKTKDVFRTYFLNNKEYIDQKNYSKIEKKTDSTEHLKKYLLENGYAYVNTQENIDKHLLSIQKEAQKNKLGIWSIPCDTKLKIRTLFSKRKRQKSQEFFVDRVKTISETMTIQTFSGKKVSLAFVSFPPERKTSAEACFLDSARKHALNALFGKPLFFRKAKKSNAYHIFVPEKKKIPGILYFNEYFIENGYARLPSLYKKNLFFSDSIFKKQTNAYKTAKGAWGICLPHLTKENHPESDPLSLKIPENLCAVKGNISGSKKNPEKKYHTKKSPWYAHTKAERCFESEKEAIEAGFEKVE